MYDDYRGGNAGGILFAFLLGGAVGAILGLLYAPRTGKETRDMLQERADDYMTQGKEMYEQGRDKVETLYEQGKTKAGETGEDLRLKFDDAKDKLKDQVDTVSAKAKEKAASASETAKSAVAKGTEKAKAVAGKASAGEEPAEA